MTKTLDDLLFDALAVFGILEALFYLEDAPQADNARTVLVQIGMHRADDLVRAIDTASMAKVSE